MCLQSRLLSVLEVVDSQTPLFAQTMEVWLSKGLLNASAFQNEFYIRRLINVYMLFEIE